MSITQTLTTSFKTELLEAIHNFGPTSPNVFKIALYSSTATLNAATTAYTSAGEITGTGYTAGGVTVGVSTSPTSSGTTAYLGFSDVSWPLATFTAAGALIYNSTQSNRSVAVLNFGGNKTVTSTTFTIQFPTPTASSAIIRIV